jgi:hypothetical protein
MIDKARHYLLAGGFLLALLGATTPAFADDSGSTTPQALDRGKTVTAPLTNGGGGGMASYTFTGDGNPATVWANFSGSGINSQDAYVNVYGPTGLFASPRVSDAATTSATFATMAGQTYTIQAAIYSPASQSNLTLSLT